MPSVWCLCQGKENITQGINVYPVVDSLFLKMTIMVSKLTGGHLMEEEDEKKKMQVWRSLFIFDSTPSRLSFRLLSLLLLARCVGV